jgi:hypothetical protein
MPIRTESHQARLESDPVGSPGPLIQAARREHRPAREVEAQVVLKTTDQLLEPEREQMCDLFLRVFNKNMTRDTFERKFFYTPRGYSYHGLMLHKQTIVGAMSAVPGRYKFFDEERIFSLSVDTMIDPEHRGGGHLLKMADLVHQGLIQDGVPFIFGFPNERFYPIQKRLLRYEDIGELDYYVLPLNIGAVVRKLRPFDGLSRSFVKWALRCCRIPRDSQIRYNIAKVADAQFEQHRYDGSYNRITLAEGAVCSYKIHEEEGGIRTLYIIDVVPLTPAFLARAVKQVFEAASGAADVIIYVGKLPSRPAGLWKVPDSRKPRRIRMTGKILIPGLVDSSVFDIKNWRVNISDFDVR